MELSFINQSELRIVPDYDALTNLLRERKAANHLLLENLDLSEVECDSIDFSGFVLRNVVFSRFLPQKNSKKCIFNLSFVGCKLERVSFAQAELKQCNFDSDERTTSMTKVDFFYSDIFVCRFRNTHLEVADFRYAHLYDCSMSDCKVRMGDFYMTGFYGTTNFIRSSFVYCSFTNACFENNCVCMASIPNGLVQEDYAMYGELLHMEDWKKYNPCAGFSHLNVYEEEKTRANDEDRELKELESKISIRDEAAMVYRIFSGIYDGKGFHNDSNKAYRRCKINEMCCYALRLKLDWKSHNWGGCIRDLWKFGALAFMRVMGFGYQWWKVVIVFVLLVLFFAMVYDVLKTNDASMDTVVAYSLTNSLGPYDEFLDVVHGLKGSLQTVIGMILVGFLGFIVANKIRNNS